MKAFILRHGNLDAAELETLPLRLLRQRSRAPPLPGDLEPRFHGHGGAPDPRADEGGLSPGAWISKRDGDHPQQAHPPAPSATAKRVRTETGIADNAVSVSFAAVELAKKIFGEPRRARPSC
ncbi:MAG: hypothetical protein MZV70_75540 [Desulfobacterales bacterium]|nr:hypothetical protein [Desulfobacterales bacterium]